MKFQFQLPWFPVLFAAPYHPQNVAALIAELRPLANKRGLRRFGPLGDGGYLMPDDLEGVRASVSPGVSTQVGFDREIADRGIDVYLADGSVAGPPIQHERFHFIRKFLDAYNSRKTVTLDDFCKNIGDGTDDLILQMDIEGAEYRVIEAASEATLNRFRMMVIEFHRLRRLRSPARLRAMRAVFGKLLKNHRVVHIHPNNCRKPVKFGGLEIPDVLEFTFYRSDRDVFERRPLRFPHPLDATNVPDKPAVVLPKCWQPAADLPGSAPEPESRAPGKRP